MGEPLLRALYRSDPTQFRQRCHALREDGAFVNAGENDARLVRKLIKGDSGLLGFLVTASWTETGTACRLRASTA